MLKVCFVFLLAIFGQSVAWYGHPFNISVGCYHVEQRRNCFYIYQPGRPTNHSQAFKLCEQNHHRLARFDTYEVYDWFSQQVLAMQELPLRCCDYSCAYHMGGKHVSRGSTTWRWVDNVQDYNGNAITNRWSNFTTYLYWDFISDAEGMILYLPRPVHLYAGKFSDIPFANTACGSICQSSF